MSRAMKDSGIPWIGEIPKDWGIYRIKYNTFLKGRIGWQGLNSNDFLDEGYCLITGTDFDNKGGINWSTCYRISKERFDEDELLHIKCGDLLMTKDGTVGKMAYIKQLPEEASLNSHLLIIRQLSELMDNSYLYWVMLSPVFKEFCAIYQAGTIMSSISQSTLGLFCCHLPSKKEQQRIAEFLDRKCGEIDEAIALQEEFIEELKAYKQSVITEAVTRGLNPNVKLKDSGIDWIGQIPQGWEETKVLNLLSMPITDGPHETPKLYDKGIPFISADAVSDGYINFENKRGYISEEYYLECCKKYTPQKGDIYMIKSGASTGRTAIVETDMIFTIWSPLAVFRVNPTYLYERFLLYVLRSDGFQKQVENKWTYGTQQNIGMRVLERLIVSYPTLKEQHQIADYLDNKCSDIDSLIAIKQQKIEELKDYKKSIIYEYVTGKKEING